MYQMTEFEKNVRKVADEIVNLLIEKNRKYGDAVMNPPNTFSKIDALEKINVRIDDKLSRIKNRQDDEDEDVEKDLIGYLILKTVYKLTKGQNNEKEKGAKK